MTFRRIAPSYILPARHDLWEQLFARLSPGDIVVANPANGPGDQVDAGWVDVITEAHNRNLVVLGYVPCAYGLFEYRWRDGAEPTRVAHVPRLTGRWSGYRPDGIFLDEFPWRADGDVDQLAASILHARRITTPRATSLDAARVVLNIGAVPDAGLLNRLPVVRCVIVHENRDPNGPSIDDIGVPPSTLISPRRQGWLSYNDPDPERTMGRLEELGWGYGYSTTDPAPLGNPWDGDPNT